METVTLTNRILQKVKDFGADDAGVCLASDLLSGPTHQKFPLPEGVQNHHFILVFALGHPPDRRAAYCLGQSLFQRRTGFKVFQSLDD
ncbi:MAG: hypothetical protein P1S59_14395, partial [bacterium]|nr:hypothetical protein [bacterium]